MSPTHTPRGPYKLVSVNTSPERAKRLIARIIQDVKEKYVLVHSANADSEFYSSDLLVYMALVAVCMLRTDLGIGIESVAPLVSEHKPDLLVSRHRPSPLFASFTQPTLHRKIPCCDAFKARVLLSPHQYTLTELRFTYSSALQCGRRPTVNAFRL
jgi:hypothetical protein